MNDEQQQEALAQAKITADLVRAEYPRLSDDELIVHLWRQLGAQMDRLSRLKYPNGA